MATRQEVCAALLSALEDQLIALAALLQELNQELDQDQDANDEETLLIAKLIGRLSDKIKGTAELANRVCTPDDSSEG